MFVGVCRRDRARRNKISFKRIVMDSSLHIIGSGRDDKEDALRVCSARVMFLGSCRRSRWNVTMVLQHYGLVTAVREGLRRWRVEWMAARCGAVVVEGRRKKRKRPRSHGSVSGAPRLYVCMCVCVCSTPVLCRWCVKGEDKGFLIYFFLHFSFLFIAAAAAITAPLRHPTTRTTLNTCSLLLSPVTVHKRDAPAANTA